MRNKTKSTIGLFTIGLLWIFIINCSTTPPAKPAIEEEEAAKESQTPEIPEEGTKIQPEALPETQEGEEEKVQVSAEVERNFEEGVKVASTNPREALKVFEAMVSSEPRFYKGFYNIGVLWEKEHEYDKAEKAYLDALRIKDDYEPAIENLARLYIRAGKDRESEFFLRDVIKKYPGLLTPRNVLVKIFLKSRRLNDAITESKKVLKADEKNVFAMLNLAEAFYRQGKHELAEMILLRVRDLEPENPYVPYWRGFIFLKRDDKSAAIRMFEEAVKKKNDFPEAHCNLGILYAEAHDYEPAIKEFHSAVAQNPKLIKAKINLANAYRGNKQYREADGLYRKIIKEAPEFMDVRYNLAILYLDNEIEGMDSIQRLQASISLFKDYLSRGGKAATSEEIAEYIEKAEKGIKREEKKREREAKKKKEEAARRKAEEEAKRKAEEEARLKAEAEARKKAEEERLKAEGGTKLMEEGAAPEEEGTKIEEVRVEEEGPGKVPGEEEELPADRLDEGK